MTPQDIRSSPFTATSGATTLAGQMSIAQYTSPSPTVDATLKTVNGKVDELLNIAKAYGVTAVEGMSGSGAITLDLHATGPIKNTDAMNFSGSGAVQNATLKTPSLTQPVNIRNVNMQFTQNSLNLTNLNAAHRLDQRQRKPQHRQLPGAAAYLCASGRQAQRHRTAEAGGPE